MITQILNSNHNDGHTEFRVSMFYPAIDFTWEIHFVNTFKGAFYSLFLFSAKTHKVTGKDVFPYTMKFLLSDIAMKRGVSLE